MSIIPAAVREWIGTATSRFGAAPGALRSVVGDGLVYSTMLAASRTVHIALAVTAMFWAVAWFADFYTLFIGVNFVVISIEVIILWTYAPAMAAALIKFPPDVQDALVMGIYVSWAADFAARIWSLWWRYNGHPMWMINTDVVTYILFLRACGAVLHVTAPAITGGKVPRRSWLLVGVGIVIGMMLMGAAVLVYGRGAPDML